MHKIICELTEDMIAEEMEISECGRERAIDYLMEKISTNIQNFSFDTEYRIVEPYKPRDKESEDEREWLGWIL